MKLLRRFLCRLLGHCWKFTPSKGLDCTRCGTRRTGCIVDESHEIRAASTTRNHNRNAFRPYASNFIRGNQDRRNRSAD